ncbi:MAG: hypothetical protein SRB2_01020 [Desulfobacteraceae bacterium Eth-SRB2]|nr:MAG: hypothetical protein SRB2_01020 [Desulfobacteraceae bacterium Eth-SRB2]
MPVVIFFTCLNLEQKSSFMDGHYLRCKMDTDSRFSKGIAESHYRIEIKSRLIITSDTYLSHETIDHFLSPHTSL